MISIGDTRLDPVIFLGAVGALRADIPIGEVDTPLESYAFDGASLYLRRRLDGADFGRRVRPGCTEYIDGVIAAAAKKGIAVAKRPTFCTDSVICEYAHMDEIRATGAELIEMETAALYECLDMLGKRGIAILCVSDNSASGVPMVGRGDEERARLHESRGRAIPELIKIACDAAN